MDDRDTWLARLLLKWKDMLVRACTVSLLCLVVAACGGSTDADGEGTGGAGGAGGSGGVPSECEVLVSGPGPYAVAFRFTNPSPKPLFVLGECHTRFSVTSCADGHQSELALWADCTQDCKLDDGAGCIACGACMYQGIEVTPGAPHQAEWSGKTFTFSQSNSGCQCHNAFSAPAGRYRISVPVYGTDAGAQNGEVLYEVEVPFELPAPGGVVDVPLS